MADYQYLRLIYHNIKQRTTNKKNPDYRYYGARGIRLCGRWRGPKGCLRFCADILSALGHRPPGLRKDGRSGWCIDRIDPCKGYELSNLRWASVELSTHNKRPTARRMACKGTRIPMFTNASAQMCQPSEVEGVLTK